MADTDKLKTLLDTVGKQVEKEREAIRKKISTKQELINFAPTKGGLYWIETDMPDDKLLTAIKETTGKQKRTRISPPKGVSFTQAINGFKMVYSGTRSNIQNRLLEHLFNEGNPKTGKLGCKIDETPFSEYGWYVSYFQLDDDPNRVAVESWWRLKIGWPPFCLR
jgi:hypothetical protein